MFDGSLMRSAANDYSHISDPNLRRRLALSEIAKVPFGMYRELDPSQLVTEVANKMLD